uniref:DUF8040 domain-containing protein n=1 Tax=Ananas comosus var. bracteatus TaxID=296719 RepID=A0A6V7NJ45_ANACO|nr:unnamed protein product [Ananas comosus var. bracteatus]
MHATSVWDDGLSDDDILVLCDAFKEEKNRNAFMSLNDSHARKWIEREIAQHNLYYSRSSFPGFRTMSAKTKVSDSAVYGHQMLCDIISGHHERCCHNFRHGVANRILAETFQHSGETISRHFNNVLRGIVRLKDEYIMLPSSNAAVHPRIRIIQIFNLSRMLLVRSTEHISVVVKRSQQAPFRCRKGFTSQNMMAAVSFDLNFLFVCTGWEGSAADMRVLRWACESGGFVFPKGSQQQHQRHEQVAESSLDVLGNFDQDPATQYVCCFDVNSYLRMKGT